MFDQDFVLTGIIFKRSLAFIYLIAFLIIFNQGKALFGENGLLPARLFIKRIEFWDSPSLFYFKFSDNILKLFSLLGIIISTLAMGGYTDSYGYLISFLSWFFLWVVYLSFVNIGQVWYGYGWESMLLETGFLAIFLGPTNLAPSIIIIYLLRWVSFRNFFGAGTIKWRGDSTWRNLTCMSWYYETQPVPNPLSMYFHRLPLWMHKTSILWTFFAEMIVPFGIFLPWGEIVAICGVLMILFQFLILLSGNLSWLNYISIVLLIPCFNDEMLSKLLTVPEVMTHSQIYQYVIYLLGLFVLWRSIGPIKNLISSRQIMNTSFDRLHLVNTYGAFGTVTRERNELVVMGTLDGDNWQEYEFKGKPTDVNRIPPLMSPYHWRLDWQMWFAAFGDYTDAPWVINLVNKLLQADKETLGLIKKSPFGAEKPKLIKIDYYNYKYQDPGKPGTWKRTYIGEWLPPLSLDHPEFRKILMEQKWMEPNEKI